MPGHLSSRSRSLYGEVCSRQDEFMRNLKDGAGQPPFSIPLARKMVELLLESSPDALEAIKKIVDMKQWVNDVLTEYVHEATGGTPSQILSASQGKPHGGDTTKIRRSRSTSRASGTTPPETKDGSVPTAFD